VSSHSLHIEAGRLAKPTATSLNDRKCLCSNSLKDHCESHFTYECTFYTD